MTDLMEITRGDKEPGLVMLIADSRADVDFTGVVASAVRIIGELNGVVVIDATIDTITVATDGKSATLKRAWGPGETDIAGRMYVRAKVSWSGGRDQTFPRRGPLKVDIRRKPGDD